MTEAFYLCVFSCIGFHIIVISPWFKTDYSAFLVIPLSSWVVYYNSNILMRWQWFKIWNYMFQIIMGLVFLFFVFCFFFAIILFASIVKSSVNLSGRVISSKTHKTAIFIPKISEIFLYNVYTKTTDNSGCSEPSLRFSLKMLLSAFNTFVFR